ncbi:MAG TPA: HD-GYP domain-containing protein [Patescibacteria group bacterium]|nr:HD-GYP domain-containing protein [Patescibacteria group bacterium]
MNRSLKVYIAGLVAVCALALAVTSLAIPVNDLIRLRVFDDVQTDIVAGIVFWTALTILASAMPVQMPRGSLISTSIAPLVVVMSLGGPAAAGWVALIGTTELRELRREIPWYGTLANHAGLALPAMLGGLVSSAVGALGATPAMSFVATLAGAAAFFVCNLALTAFLLSLRRGQSIVRVIRGDMPAYVWTFLGLVPLAWLMSKVYVLEGVGWWAIFLVLLPVHLIRVSLSRFVEMRRMFTQTVASLAQAVDARDKFTSGHSIRVKQISVDIGRVMRRSEKELEALEWGGLLHDIGKIGVPDNVLNKPDRLTREERAIMNAHPVIGANIIAPVEKLAPELPIIRHHHEWYNGSGYPDRLMGDEIPVLARILHVADAFEAMTAARPYRMTPLTSEEAMAELRKFAGIQFDPAIVDSFTKTHWAKGVSDPGRATEPRPPVPFIAQVGGLRTQAATADAPATTAAGRTAPSATAAAPEPAS